MFYRSVLGESTASFRRSRQRVTHACRPWYIALYLSICDLFQNAVTITITQDENLATRPSFKYLSPCGHTHLFLLSARRHRLCHRICLMATVTLLVVHVPHQRPVMRRQVLRNLTRIVRRNMATQRLVQCLVQPGILQPFPPAILSRISPYRIIVLLTPERIGTAVG